MRLSPSPKLPECLQEDAEWLGAIKYAMTTVVAIGLICAFAIFVLDIPLPWKTANAGRSTVARGTGER